MKTPLDNEDDNFMKKWSPLFFLPWDDQEQKHAEEPQKEEEASEEKAGGKKFGLAEILEATPWGRQDSNKGSKKWNKEEERAWEEILLGVKGKGKGETSKKEKGSVSGSESDPTWTII